MVTNISIVVIIILSFTHDRFTLMMYLEKNYY